MAVHGRYGQPCPDCGSKVQRIVHADNETHCCARCQTGGKLLADRALSRLLKPAGPGTSTTRRADDTRRQRARRAKSSAYAAIGADSRFRVRGVR